MSQAQFPLSEHFSPSISLIEGRPATTSLAIAEHFGKRHDHVCRDIRKLIDNTPESFHAPNFGEMSHTIKIGNRAERQETYFTVFFDGFILLVMGYTGKKALQVKLVYINAFNAMKEKLDKLAAEERARLAGDVKAIPVVDSLPEASITITPSTTSDRAPLRSIVNAWARVSGLPHDALWPQVRAAFNLARIDELPAEWVPDAIAWVQDKIDALPRPLLPTAPVTPPADPSVPAVPQPVLSAELDRYAAEFEAIARHIEQLPGLLQRVERVASPLVSDACRRLAGADRVRQAHLDTALTDMLDGSRRMADDLVPRARLGINVMRDLARAQGR